MKTITIDLKIAKAAAAQDFTYLPGHPDTPDGSASFLCPKGHRFERRATGLRTYPTLSCPTCHKEAWATELHAIALARGGVCLRLPSVSTDKAVMRCALGHEWAALRGALRQGNWCPYCGQAKQALRSTAQSDETRRAVEATGFTILGEEQKGEDGLRRYRLRCANGHEFVRTAGGHLVRPVCSQCRQPEKQAENETKAAAIERTLKAAGLLLLGPYEKTTKELALRCRNGHQFERLPQSVMAGNITCPHCKSRKAEDEALLNTLLEAAALTLLSPYQTQHKKLTLRCLNGHVFQRKAQSVLRGCTGCPECKKQPPIDAKRMG